jgi:hypothetical protein
MTDYQKLLDKIKAEAQQLDKQIDNIADSAKYQAIKAEFNEGLVEHLNVVLAAKLPGKTNEEKSCFISGFWLGLKYWQQYGQVAVEANQEVRLDDNGYPVKKS